MMKLVDKKKDIKALRAELYVELLQTNIASMSVQRFEHIYRRIHILTQKIVSFKGGLNNDTE